MELGQPKNQRLKILVVEDDALFREQIEKYLGVYNDLDGAAGLQIARTKISQNQYDVVLLDKTLEDGSGLDLIPEIRNHQSSAVILVLTGDPNLNIVQKCLDAGASDYLQKSENILPELLIRLPLALRNAAMKRRNEALEEKVSSAFRYEIVGHSKATEELRKLIDECADTSSPILIQGESGTGKELVARRINAIRNKGRRFVAVNCGAIPENLVESELFGHARGAFTGAHQDKMGLFEQASGGDLFLDEIGELPLSAQSKLLRVIQEGEVRRIGEAHARRIQTRIIAATNRTLEQMVADGEFREDLYYRLNVFFIPTTPLRERPDDIPDLSRYFVNQISQGQLSISPESEQVLAKMPWAGNTRELRNAIERGILVARRRKSKIVEKIDLQFRTGAVTTNAKDQSTLPSLPRDVTRVNSSSLADFMNTCEKAYIERILELCEGHQQNTAQLLGFSKTTLFRRMTDLEIEKGRPGLRPVSSSSSSNSTAAALKKMEQTL